eukprot:CAMPEP_0115857018 /NCGR_PEP_ID=MMETSP0287-20121206/15357_1 /TAXON_ID=412157 /ORGANISM="Chrysochromulina rotalis, Strain UIO044" /LENGTH=102 /DNA_ID=CAMNT_0003311221 /DNA_START=234 /DNA_END=542 /DNA_ORIENTATION=+
MEHGWACSLQTQRENSLLLRFLLRFLLVFRRFLAREADEELPPLKLSVAQRLDRLGGGLDVLEGHNGEASRLLGCATCRQVNGACAGRGHVRLHSGRFDREG